MPNINKNIIMQAGAAVANATNKAAGLSAATPEPGSIISAIQLVNGGRTIGPAALAHFTESVRNKLLSLLVSIEPIQSGSGTPSPDNVRPISGRTGLNVYVSPTPNAADATTYSVDWTSEAGTVYGGTLDVVTGVLTVNMAMVDLGTLTWTYSSGGQGLFYSNGIVSTAKKPPSNGVKANILCSDYACYSANGVYQGGVGVALNVSPQVWYHDGVHTDSDLVGGKAQWLDGVYLVYELATPLTYQLTGTDIVTLVGDNYIWSDSGDVTITE